MLTSHAPWFALAGVVVGFALAEGSRYARYRWEIRRNKRVIHAELQTVLAQLPQKRDILRQALGHLKNKELLPTLACHAVTAGYYSVLETLYPYLTQNERSCLHIIFERVRVADEQMDSFEDDFIRAMKEKVIHDPWATYMGRVQELLDSYDVVEHLALAYLAGDPPDVFRLEQPQ